MYIGEIPGMYYDKQKNKYFSIQADRNSTSSASKYSQSQVLREERLVKRQKVEDDNRCRARSQTVTRASILQNPIAGGAGLSKEIAHRPLGHRHLQQQDAVLAGLQPHRVQVIAPENDEFSRITHLQWIPEADVTILAGASGGSTQIMHYVGPSDSMLQPQAHSCFYLPEATMARVIPNQICSMACTTFGKKTFVLLCDNSGEWSLHALEVREEEKIRGDGTGGPTGDDDDQLRTILTHWPRRTHVHHTIRDVKFQPGVPEPSFALAGSREVNLLDSEMPGLHARWPAVRPSRKVTLPLADQMEATALSWMSPRILAVAIVPFPKTASPHASGNKTTRGASGQRTGRRTTEHRPLLDPHLRNEVRLWDIRIRDSSSRLLPPSRLTGLSSVPLPSTLLSTSTPESPNPYYILTTSTSGISMHDLRFTPTEPVSGTTRPLWTAAHASQTPRLPLAVNAGLDVVSAVDREGIVQCYSLANGQNVRGLRCEVDNLDYVWSDACLGVPRWQEDSRGAPYLCVGGRDGWVYSWKW